jgi:hypothetical protein
MVLSHPSISMWVWERCSLDEESLLTRCCLSVRHLFWLYMCMRGVCHIRCGYVYLCLVRVCPGPNWCCSCGMGGAATVFRRKFSLVFWSCARYISFVWMSPLLKLLRISHVDCFSGNTPTHVSFVTHPHMFLSLGKEENLRIVLRIVWQIRQFVELNGAATGACNSIPGCGSQSPSTCAVKFHVWIHWRAIFSSVSIFLYSSLVSRLCI